MNDKCEEKKKILYVSKKNPNANKNANAKANGVVEELCGIMDTKVLYISKNTALMNR